MTFKRRWRQQTSETFDFVSDFGVSCNKKAKGIELVLGMGLYERLLILTLSATKRIASIQSGCECQTLLAAAAIILSTETHRLSECLERPFIGRRLSSPIAVVVAASWSVSNRPSTGERL